MYINIYNVYIIIYVYGYFYISHQTIENYMSIGGNGDSDSGIINQPEGWLTITPLCVTMIPKKLTFFYKIAHMYLHLSIYIYIYINVSIQIWNL
jgi:hypothetical protein